MIRHISISDTTKLAETSYSLGLLITVGKYLHLIIASFATLNIILAYLDLFVWGYIGFGIFNVLLGLGGYIFLGQLLKRHKIKRIDHRFAARNQNTIQRRKSLKLRKGSKVAA
jgi:hypothetical protein